MIARQILGQRGRRERDEPAQADEPVRLTRIYTRGGDAGETSLGDGSRVSKLDPARAGVRRRRRAQLGARLGAGRGETSGSRGSRTSSSTSAPTSPCRTPRATAGCGSSQDAVDRLEEECDEANAALPELRSFVLPGGTEAAARLHVARAVCRRTEREVLAAARRARGEPARARLPEPPQRPPVHPRPRGQHRRRRAALGSRGAWASEPADQGEGPEREGQLCSTISGVENEPLYAPDRWRSTTRGIWASRASIRSRGACTRRCTAAGCGRCGSSRGSGRRRRRTSGSAICWSTGRPGCRRRSTCRR